MDELVEIFSAQRAWSNYPLDTSTFVRLSIEEVVKTLVEAIALVFLVMYVFLQNIRATFIPTIVGAGRTARHVRRACCVRFLDQRAEHVRHGARDWHSRRRRDRRDRKRRAHHDGGGLSPREATRKAMGQITGALIGITLVLTAVFIPMAFFPGSVGAIYRQFSVALVASMLFSVFLAMSLTPALCATLLQPVEKGAHHERARIFWLVQSRASRASTTRYHGVVARMLKDHRALHDRVRRHRRAGRLALCAHAVGISAG